MTVKGVLLGGLPVQLLLFASLHAQVVPLPADNEVAIGALNLQTAVAPAGQTVTYVNVTVDPSANGGDWIEVIVGDDPASSLTTIPSLTLPNGTEMTAVNASAGFNFSTYSFNIASYSDFPSMESDAAHSWTCAD
jgi:hypothetical protein